jgi:membrane protease YdiL (CAAX protease family)
MYLTLDPLGLGLVESMCVYDVATALLVWRLAPVCLSRAEGRSLPDGRGGFREAAVSVVCVMVTWLVGMLCATCAVNEFSVTLDSTFGSSSVALVAFFGCAIAPLAEEFLNRGFVWSRLRESMGAVASALLCSAIFALWHLNLAQVPNAFLLSMVACGMRERGLNIWWCVGLHAFSNALSFVVAPYLQVPDAMVSLPFVTVSFLLVTTALVALARWVVSLECAQ